MNSYSDKKGPTLRCFRRTIGSSTEIINHKIYRLLRHKTDRAPTSISTSHQMTYPTLFIATKYNIQRNCQFFEANIIPPVIRWCHNGSQPLSGKIRHYSTVTSVCGHTRISGTDVPALNYQSRPTEARILVVSSVPCIGDDWWRNMRASFPSRFRVYITLFAVYCQLNIYSHRNETNSISIRSFGGI